MHVSVYHAVLRPHNTVTLITILVYIFATLRKSFYATIIVLISMWTFVIVVSLESFIQG